MAHNTTQHIYFFSYIKSQSPHKEGNNITANI